MEKDPYTRKIPIIPLRNRKCSDIALDFVCSLLSTDPNERPSARECSLHPWLSKDAIHNITSPRVQNILPPTEIMGSPSTVRATPRLSSPEPDSSFGSSSASSPFWASSGESQDDQTLSANSIQGSPKLPPAASFFSDRMDICSIRSGDVCMRGPDSTFTRTASPMKVDTMIPAERVWCIFYPLPGNAAGTTTLFLKKTTTTVGSDTEADLVLRHPKIADLHCTIVSGPWYKERGLTGIIHIQDKNPVRFQDKSTVYILDDQNGISSLFE
jgi:serine/threonine protein kinase